jgi:hypothetical protein
MNPQVSWRQERENIDQLLARVSSDPDFRHLLSIDPVKAIGDYSDVPAERNFAAPKCGPLKTSCPPGKTCAKKSCVKTLISIV